MTQQMPMVDGTIYDVPLTVLIPFSGNPRVGNVEAISESLTLNGQYRPIVVRRETREILAGNHTWKAAVSLNWDTIKVTYVENITDEQAKRIVLADNRYSDIAEYDNDVLLALLKTMEDLEGSGYTPLDLDDLIEELGGRNNTELTDEDSVPNTPEIPYSKPGDVWLLGPHRLICGDATVTTDYDVLLGEERADLLWTDPPYGVNYVGGTDEALQILNDDSAGLKQLLEESLGTAITYTEPGACWFVTSPSGPPHVEFSVVLRDLGVLRQLMMWVKSSLVLGHSDYHYMHENLYYGWTPGASHHEPPDRKGTSVWEFDKPARNGVHPTMKPVELIVRSITNHTNPRDIVLDPFSGSGSTLIACHQTDRVARCIELDPKYVDVICRRFQEHTGTVPVLQSTGEPHDFTLGNESD